MTRRFENNDPFRPWNHPMHEDDPFAPWNNPMYEDDPFAPWNSPISSDRDLDDYCKRRGIRREDRHHW